METEVACWHRNNCKISINKIVTTSINWGEAHIYKPVKSSGGKWNDTNKLWELPDGDGFDLGSKGSIVYDSQRNSLY